jgi:Icc-related predicted phosphoesterase
MLVFIGDVHGKWKHLQIVLNKFEQRQTTFIQVGDFGYFPESYSVWPPSFDVPNKSKFFWIDGNHENFWHMRDNIICDTPKELKENVFYVPRGTVLSIENKNVLFIGGAESIDKDSRMLGRCWFPEESITYSDFEKAIDNCNGKQIDIVVSHAAPKSFDIIDENIFEDFSRTALDEILKIVSPSLWVFGHYHKKKCGVFNNTKWVGLNICEAVEYGEII